MIELKWQKDCMSMVGKEASVWLLNLDHTYKKFHYLRQHYLSHFQSLFLDLFEFYSRNSFCFGHYKK